MAQHAPFPVRDRGIGGTGEQPARSRSGIDGTRSALT